MPIPLVLWGLGALAAAVVTAAAVSDSDSKSSSGEDDYKSSIKNAEEQRRRHRNKLVEDGLVDLTLWRWRTVQQQLSKHDIALAILNGKTDSSGAVSSTLSKMAAKKKFTVALIDKASLRETFLLIEGLVAIGGDLSSVNIPNSERLDKVSRQGLRKVEPTDEQLPKLLEHVGLPSDCSGEVYRLLSGHMLVLEVSGITKEVSDSMRILTNRYGERTGITDDNTYACQSDPAFRWTSDQFKSMRSGKQYILKPPALLSLAVNNFS